MKGGEVFSFKDFTSEHRALVKEFINEARAMAVQADPLSHPGTRYRHRMGIVRL
jgi:hypothetical protein